MKRIAPRLSLVAALTLSCSSPSEFDTGSRQAEQSWAGGSKVLVDYFDAPGVERYDGQFGLRIAGCETPHARLVQILQSGARSGEEIHAALADSPVHTVNLINEDTYRQEDVVPRLVECYGDKQTCSWLVLVRPAPVASEAWVAGFNSRMLQHAASGTECESVMTEIREFARDETR